MTTALPLPNPTRERAYLDRPQCYACGKCWVTAPGAVCERCQSRLGSAYLPRCRKCGARPFQAYWDKCCGRCTKLLPDEPPTEDPPDLPHHCGGQSRSGKGRFVKASERNG